MAEIARMRFKSVQRPQEHGALVLHDDGTFQVEPSDEFRDRMAELEEQALRHSQIYGTRLGLALIALGTLGVAIGWAFGRVFGKLGSSVSAARPTEDVQITHDENGNFQVALRGAESRFQTVQMRWNPDEVLQPEAEAFVQKFREMRGPRP